MIVNKDLVKSRHCAPQFRTAPRRVQHVSAYSGELTPFEGEDVWLPPGGRRPKLEGNPKSEARIPSRRGMPISHRITT
jgi:hypothetical protein